MIRVAALTSLEGPNILRISTLNLAALSIHYLISAFSGSSGSSIYFFKNGSTHF